MKFTFGKLLISLPLLFQIYSCSENKEEGKQKIFEKISPEKSGINFTNTVPENDTLNQFTYHYLYNGNGVAAGDINNDGKVDLLFTGNEIPAKLYLNKGDFSFEDITTQSGIKTSGWMSGATMADVNNDGYLDIYICKSGPNNADKRNYLFINNKNSTFTESAKLWGVDDNGNTTCATFFDFDNDADLDLYIGNHAEKFFSDIETQYSNNIRRTPNSQQRFFENTGSKFIEITEKAGMNFGGYCLSATAADFNMDGFTDLYVCMDYHIPDLYFINNGKGGFEEKHTTYFKHSTANSMGADFADINNDGFLDLFTVDMLMEDPKRFMLLEGPRKYDFVYMAEKNGYRKQYMRNALQVNRNGYFSDYGFLAGVARTDWSWSPVFGDFDNDGNIDLFVSNGYYRDVTNKDFMLFQERRISKEKGKVTNKEILEKLPFEKIKNYTFKNNGDYTFSNVTDIWGIDELSLATAALQADLDGDGNMDMVICNQGEPASIYKNIVNNKNFLNIKCKGGKKNNIQGVGSKVYVEFDSTIQSHEIQHTHGYQSGSEAMIHVGTGNKKPKKITVVWPNGEFESIPNPQIGNTLVFDENNANGKFDYKKFFSSPTILDITETAGLAFVHQESNLTDFKRQVLSPGDFTRLGPGAATGDVNGDGLQDVIIGNGGTGAGPAVFMQTSDGKLVQKSSPALQIMKGVDVLGCLLFDADQDGDNDLLLVAGGSELGWPDSRYKHQLFSNDGKGNFTHNPAALPNHLSSSGSCAIAGDIDLDGDLDLFIAGRIMPGGLYPNPACQSYLLINDKGNFSDASAQWIPGLDRGIMVCAALFSDYNGDKKPDLILTGEYMQVAFLANTGSKFENKTQEAGTQNSLGWYNSLLEIDIDNDGDFDYVAGNRGHNSYIRAGKGFQTNIYWADFDNNNEIDITMGWSNGGMEYPLFQLDEMGSEYPVFMNKRFNTYADISSKSLAEIFGADNLNKNKMFVNDFTSVLLLNNNGSFTAIALPNEVQAGPIFGLYAADLDGNGFEDIIGIGNSHSNRAQHGPDDALNGFVLYNEKGNLTYSDGRKNGFYVPGDAKSLVPIALQGKGFCLIANQNSGASRVFQMSPKMAFATAQKNEISAEIETNNGKTKKSLSYGYGYLSSTVPGIWHHTHNKVVFYDSKNSIRKN